VELFEGYKKNSATDTDAARDTLRCDVSRYGFSIAAMLGMEDVITPQTDFSFLWPQVSKEDAEKLLIELEKRGWK
jgi:hypothetical protein